MITPNNMPNMSYCQFRNTLRDLHDCECALRQGNPLSKEEYKSAKQLIEVCVDIAKDYDPDDLIYDEDEDEDGE